MGGVASAIGGAVGDVLTLGTSHIPGSPTGILKKGISGIVTGGTDGSLSSLGGGGNGSSTAPAVGGSQNPLQMLTQSGGAPLLTNIALGADVGTSLMGYFGASGDYKSWFNNLNPSDQQAIQGLHDQLTQVQTNTDLRNQAVQKLSTDFPNIMASKIPQYSAMADSATQQMMDQALKQISAQQAAGGTFSSGATAQAAANAGASLGMQKLQYGTNLALNDFNAQYSQASALQNFQQKMLGQGATQGFNAVQNALGRNAGIAGQQANLNFQADQANQQSNNAMLGAVGQLGGTVLGGMFGGPAGAAIGGQVGGIFGGAPRLNMAGSGYGGAPNSQYGMGAPNPSQAFRGY